MQPQYQYPAPQQPPMPQYPAQSYPAQQPYPVQAPVAYPQQYAPPVPAQPTAPPPPPGTLDQFYSQPSTGGGPSWKFQDPTTRQPMIGKSYEGFVARPLTDADIQAQTNDSGQVQTFRDGRVKYVMKVPMQFPATQEHPEGLAQWYVKGQARDELARAMAEAGAPAGPPEHGAWIRVTLVSIRPIPGRNPAYQYRVEYRRPAGAAPVAPGTEVIPSQPPAAVAQPAPVQQYPQAYAPPPAMGGIAPGQTVPQAPIAPPPAMPQQPAPAPVAQQPAPQPVAQAPAADPRLAQLTPEQQQLLASLTGGTAAPAQAAG